jgi:hypothetical protein
MQGDLKNLDLQPAAYRMPNRDKRHKRTAQSATAESRPPGTNLNPIADATACSM